MKISHFNIANFRVDGGAMFGVVPKSMWSRVYPSDEKNLIPLSLKSLVVEDNGRVVLIDNGIGSKQDAKFMSHVYAFGGEGLLPGLAARGYMPDDITDVVLTHLHFDHCGGGIFRDAHGKLQLTFPNARYHVSAEQWDWATHPNSREDDSFLPENILPMKELGALHLVESEGELIPGLSLRIFNGHTHGQLIPVISYRGETLVFCADLFSFTAHIPLPWIMSYDVEPLKTLEEKEQFLNEALQGNYILLYEHDYFTDCSRVQLTSKGIRATEGFTFQQLLKQLNE